MKHKKAERMVGYEITVERVRSTHWKVTGTHPIYGYAIEMTGGPEYALLGQFVGENYKIISRIVFEEQCYRCLNCGRLLPLQADHIQMRSHGRIDTRENLRGLCAACHERRHSLPDWEPCFTIEDLKLRAEGGS